MSLQKHYNNLYNNSIKLIETGNYDVDSLLESPSDKRFGITLLARPSEEVKNSIQQFLNDLKTTNPNQYYYQNSDIHMTVMSIISCYDGFELNQINVQEYVQVIKESLNSISNFNIHFKGITTSSSCVMIQGFTDNEMLNNSRNTLRINFKNSNLQQSIDQRYTIQTAHTTVVRFKEPLLNTPHFIEVLKAYRHFNFGTFNVKTLELVYNDWYQKAKFVKTLSNFSI